MLLVDDEVCELEHQAELLLDADGHLFGSSSLEIELSNSAYYVAERMSLGDSSWDIIIADVFMQPTRPTVDGQIETSATKSALRVRGRSLPFFKYVPRVSWMGPRQADPKHGGILIVDAISGRPSRLRAPRKVILVSQFSDNPILTRVRSRASEHRAWLDYRDKAYWTLRDGGAVAPEVYVLALGQAIAQIKSAADVGSPRLHSGRFLSASPELQAIEARIGALATSTIDNVWISGEQGTGRGTTARLLHEQLMEAHRLPGRFVEFSPASVAEARFEAELLGHCQEGARGSVEHAGAVQQAEHGTLLVRDIEQLRNPRQCHAMAALLRRAPVKRLDGTLIDTSSISLVIITSTDPAAEALIAQLDHELRRELPYLQRFTIPPLRQRPRDVSLIASETVRTLHTRHRNMTVSAEADEILRREQWQDGNVGALIRVARLAGLEETSAQLTAGRVEAALHEVGREIRRRRTLQLPERWSPAEVNEASANAVLDALPGDLLDLQTVLRSVRQNQEAHSLASFKEAQPALAVLERLTGADFKDLMSGKRPWQIAHRLAARRYTEDTGQHRGEHAIKDWKDKRRRFRRRSPH